MFVFVCQLCAFEGKGSPKEEIFSEVFFIQAFQDPTDSYVTTLFMMPLTYITSDCCGS